MAHTEVVPEMNFNFGSGNIFGTCNNNCSAKFSFTFFVNFTYSFNFTLEASTNALMSLGGFQWAATQGRSTQDLVAGVAPVYVPMTGNFTDTGDDSYLYLKIEYVGQSEMIMPLEFFSCGLTPDAVVEQQTVS